MSIKAGVRVLGVRPETVLAIQEARELYKERGEVFVVTSVIEGAHSRASLHYTGCAFDLRLPKNDPAGLVDELRTRLGDDFDVILEVDHIHVEFQPKAPY